MKWFKKKQNDDLVEAITYDMYPLRIFIKSNTTKEGDLMRSSTMWYPNRDDLERACKDNYIYFDDNWWRIIQRHKIKGNYMIVVESIAIYHELVEYKINKNDTNED